ncbi:interferon-inducible GTPase 5-like isoform X1 [Protopterus annectens]|uniref:interferon-inducible GTPase 5-like isoform X1 n=1 Tax=Protopterus annectens TaxID=7888 RepID=UPI001CFB154F|nr:interferon-inducible GTPase 5-like isoform X1 [Protopterus annectens]
MAGLQTISEQELTEMKNTVQSKVVLEVAAQIHNLLDSLEKAELNIAVTGESGAGKSTFINALRGLSDEDKDAAPTGVTETTMVPIVYPHPKLPNVQLWDLPGIGTPSFQPNQYLEQVTFNQYDFFIIVASERFRENPARLATAIKAMNKKFYFVRSKVDLDVDASMRRRKAMFSEESVLNEIRRNCIQCLEHHSIQSAKVFLLSSFELNKYDFQYFQDTLAEELDKHKRHAFLLSLPNISAASIEKKKESLKGHVWKKALSVCLASVLPGCSVQNSIPLLTKTLTSYQQSFGLDDSSLCKLANQMNKSPHDLKTAIHSTIGKDISNYKVESLLNEAALSSSSVLSMVENWVPVVGVLVSGGVSFAAAYTLLNSSLDDFAQDSKRVLRRALGDAEEEKSEDAYSGDDAYLIFD